MRDTNRQWKDSRTLCITLHADAQHVGIELLEWELGEQGDQILFTEQQPAALWVLILNTGQCSWRVSDNKLLL